MAATKAAMSWEDLDAHVRKTGSLDRDRVNGPTNSQSRLRLFGGDEESVRVTLFRDNHAWCPYCQKGGWRLSLSGPLSPSPSIALC